MAVQSLSVFVDSKVLPRPLADFRGQRWLLWGKQQRYLFRGHTVMLPVNTSPEALMIGPFCSESTRWPTPSRRRDGTVTTTPRPIKRQATRSTSHHSFKKKGWAG
jgi:hypothetical protein